MAHSYFQFKQFIVRQDLCAMKVGTDGTLLGAWANGGPSILDIGTGTGLIALMMAQRFPSSQLTAIDIDADACRQASDNAAASPFASRVSVSHVPLQRFVPPSLPSGQPTLFSAIVCNPPYFHSSLQSPDPRRTVARHTTALPRRLLFSAVARLLHPLGEFSLIIPAQCRSDIDTEAAVAGLFPSRVCSVYTSPRKPVRRFLLAFSKQPAAVETTQLLLGSPQHQALMSQFLL